MDNVTKLLEMILTSADVDAAIDLALSLIDSYSASNQERQGSVPDLFHQVPETSREAV